MEDEARTTPDEPTDAHESSRSLSRRRLLAAGAGGALALGTAGLVSPERAASAIRALAATPKKGGTLRVGIGGGSADDDFDAAHINFPSETTRDQVFYETLTYLDGHMQTHRDFLCTSCEPDKTATVWTAKLKPHVEFHNGKTLTADDVLFSIRRILNPKSAATIAGQLAILDLARTKKLDKNTVQFVLKTPNSYFDQLLADAVYIVPVGYNPKNPVSTGPWKFKSFTPGVRTVLERYENYHGTPAWADTLILIELSDDTARVNALLTGQVDVINQVPYAQVAQLKQQKNLQVVVSPTGAWNPITMRVDVQPFNDFRVRQAIRLCMDRKQAVAAALVGQGVTASDVYGRYDPSFDSSMYHREQDIEQAKFLLKKAGKSDLKLELVTANVAAGLVQACQVLAQNAKAAGVTINVRNLDIASFFTRYTKWPFSVDYWVGLPYMVLASIADGPQAHVVNATHFNDPQFNQLYTQASKQLSASKRIPIEHEMQRIQFQRGGYLIWSFNNTVDAYSNKVGGIQKVDWTGWGLGRCQLHKLYFA